MKVRINTFAILKEHFAHNFEIEVYDVKSISDLKEELSRIKPGTKELLNISRFAINNCFVNETEIINENDSIFIIPPSSGG